MRWKVLLAGIAVLGGCERIEERFRPLAVGEPVPAYAVRTLAGDTARVGTAQPVTLLHVWATWCGPCEKEFPEIERLHRDFGTRGLRVLAVSVDNGSDAKVESFVREHGATFTIGRDESGTVRELYQSIGVPESYLISADGRLLWRHIGALAEGGAVARAQIERALAPRPTD